MYTATTRVVGGKEEQNWRGKKSREMKKGEEKSRIVKKGGERREEQQ